MFGSNSWIDKYIRAGKQETQDCELLELARSDDAKIRTRVAENPNTTRHILRLLARDDNPEVRLAVGLNKSSPLDLILDLVLDENPTVRYGMAEDPNLPLNLLSILCQDENVYVSQRALKTLAQLTVRVDEHHEVINFPGSGPRQRHVNKHQFA